LRERLKADLEIRKRIEDLEALKTVALNIVSARDRGELYTAIVTSVVELLDCDASGITLYDAENNLVSFPFVYNLPENIKDIEYGLDSDVFSTVIHMGRAISIEDYQVSPNKIKVLSGAGLRAMVLIPLKARGRVRGVLWAASLNKKRIFSDYDMVLIGSVGGQAAVAIDNINLFEEQHYISAVLQRGFLPERMPALSHTDIGIFYASATEAAVVGGDFYDFIALDEGRIGFVLGDSSGHGVEATADAAMVKYTLRSALYQNPQPSSALSGANYVAYNQLTDGHFVTLVYSYYDDEDGRLLLGIAGHPSPVHYLVDRGKIELVEGQDPAFGLIKDYAFSEIELTLSPGDIFALYTDGLIELRHNKEFFGIERLTDILAANATMTAQQIADKVIDAAREFSMGRFTDDIVLMVIKRRAK